eukprot:2888376-Prymnesium_polylepis.1
MRAAARSPRGCVARAACGRGPRASRICAVLARLRAARDRAAALWVPGPAATRARLRRGVLARSAQPRFVGRRRSRF